MASTRDRLAQLRATVDRANGQLEKLEEEKVAIEAELETLQGAIDAQRQKLSDESADLTQIDDNVAQLRDAARKTQRVLDKALKEIAGWNDEIEKSASDRHAIYRRCRLEEIDLPLIKGNLNKVPIEENREDELAMDMDVDDEGTQQVKEADDYGVEPDFDQLEDEDREVSLSLFNRRRRGVSAYDGDFWGADESNFERRVAADKQNSSEEVNRDFEAQIAKLKADLEKTVPNMKAIERLAEVQDNLDDAEREADQTRRDSKKAKEKYLELKKRRSVWFRLVNSRERGSRNSKLTIQVRPVQRGI